MRVDDRLQIKRIALCGQLIAIAFILDGFLKIPINLFGAYALKLSLGMTPILFISIRYGSLYGGICGAIMDILQAVLFPMGAFNPLITVGAFVMGAIPGLFFMRSAQLTKIRLAAAISCGQTIGSVLLNTLFIAISYQLPFAIIWPRAITQAIMIPTFSIMVWYALKLENQLHGTYSPHITTTGSKNFISLKN